VLFIIQSQERKSMTLNKGALLDQTGCLIVGSNVNVIAALKASKTIKMEGANYIK